VSIATLLSVHFQQTGERAAALARRLGVSEATLARWRSGEQIPEDIRAAALAGEIGLRESDVADAIRAARIERQRHRELTRKHPDPGVAALSGTLESCTDDQLIELVAQARRILAARGWPGLAD
jgi:transcriptional regulator with XRE-family HTH domain